MRKWTLRAAVAAVLLTVAGPVALANTAVLRGLDKVTGVARNFDAPVGRTVQFGSLNVTVRACVQRPPEELPETSVYLEVTDRGRGAEGEEAKPVFAGWIFASDPGRNGLAHPVYDVWAIRCKA